VIKLDKGIDVEDKAYKVEKSTDIIAMDSVLSTICGGLHVLPQHSYIDV